MELFAVNRYDPLKNKLDPNHENRILESLQKNIAKKKKKQKKEKQEKSVAIVENVIDMPDDVAVPDEIQVDMEEDEPAAPVTEPLLDNQSLMVIGNDKFQRKQRIDAVLPPWLAYPTIISNDLSVPDNAQMAEIPFLSANLIVTLNTMDIQRLFPVQAAVIPWIIDAHHKPSPFRPRDICVSAPTGSGKTLAYALPIVQLLLDRSDRQVRALVVLPVNELAVQVLKVFRTLCEGTTLKCTLLSKFNGIESEKSELVERFNGHYHSKVDIVVATTGRLVEHLHSTPGFSLRSLQFLVMDEADRIMEQIHNNWFYHLDSHVKEQSDTYLTGRAVPLCYAELKREANRQPHKLLFSATLSQDPEKLQSLQLFQPKLFTAVVGQFRTNGENNKPTTSGEFIGKFTTPAELTELYCVTEAKLKPLTLFSLIKENQWNRFLCFTNSGESAHRLSFVLQSLLGADLKIEELSSGLSTNVRNGVLLKFQMAKINGLICSDALARGIDIKGVDIVISYEAPRHIKTYIHRIGRTARAGKPGIAVTLLAKHELHGFQNIVRQGDKSELNELKVTSNTEELSAKVYAAAVEKLQVALKREHQIKIMKGINEKQKPVVKTQANGFIGQLQSLMQGGGDAVGRFDDHNLPESWKWENQMNIKARRERKNKNKKKTIKKAIKKPTAEVVAVDGT